MHIYSLIVVQGLDLGEPVEMVRMVMQKILHEDFLIGMESILKWMVPSVGLDYSEGLVDDEIEELYGRPGLKPFICWPKGKYEAHCHEEARLGWKVLKLFIE